MRRAKLIKRNEIVEQEKRTEKRKAAGTVGGAKQALSTVRSWVKQRQTVQTSAYKAFAALFTEPKAKGIA